MNVTSKINVDLTRANIGARVNAVQGDGNTRSVEITLLSDGRPWTPPEGVDVAIAYYQPGGTRGLYNLLADGEPAISITGNVATVILAPQMLTASGTVQASLVFNDTQLNRLTTFPFSVSVASNPAAGAQKTEDYLRLQWMEDKLEEYLAAIKASGVFDGKPGDNGVTFTPSVSENGDLSWSNDGGRPNPPTVNIKGPKPVNGVDYGTPEQLAGIAHQAAEILQPDLSQIEDDLADKAMQYRGNVIDLGYTSFAECLKIGLYSFRSSDVGSITDFPTSNLYLDKVGTRNGILIACEKGVNTTNPSQIVIDDLNRVWFRQNLTNDWSDNILNEPSSVNNLNDECHAVPNQNYIKTILTAFDVRRLYTKESTGTGAKIIKFDISNVVGDTLKFGVLDATYDTFISLEIQKENSDGTFTKIQDISVGEDYCFTVDCEMVGLRFYLNATGSTTLIAYAMNESDNSIGSSIARLIDEINITNQKINAPYKYTKSNGMSAYLYEVSPLEHDVQLRFKQKNLFNPKCELNLTATSVSGVYAFAKSDYANANTIQLEGISAITVSGSMSGLNSGILRYIFSADYPKVGEPVITSGATKGGTLTVPDGAKYFTWFTGSYAITEVTSEIMINSGSTALDYVPYYSEFELEVADDGNHTNAEYVTIGANGGFVKSRSPQMHIRVTNASGITIEQTYFLDYRNILGFNFSKESVSIGKGQEKVKNKTQCIAIGGNNLSKSDNGIKNTTIGFDNMYQTSGSRNTSIGYHALFRNTTANDGTAIGAEALDDNTSGLNNTACGAYAMQRNAKGSNNAVLGFRALNGTAQHNVFDENAEYNGNTVVGAKAMENKGSGNNNTAIGFQAMTSEANVNGCVALGYNAQCDKDNQMVLGGSNITEVVMCGNKKIIFNADGTVTWESI